MNVEDCRRHVGRMRNGGDGMKQWEETVGMVIGFAEGAAWTLYLRRMTISGGICAVTPAVSRKGRFYSFYLHKRRQVRWRTPLTLTQPLGRMTNFAREVWGKGGCG